MDSWRGEGGEQGGQHIRALSGWRQKGYMGAKNCTGMGDTQLRRHTAIAADLLWVLVVEGIFPRDEFPGQHPHGPPVHDAPVHLHVAMARPSMPRRRDHAHVTMPRPPMPRRRDHAHVTMPRRLDAQRLYAVIPTSQAHVHTQVFRVPKNTRIQLPAIHTSRKPSGDIK
jgi:hypothetical protein